MRSTDYTKEDRNRLAVRAQQGDVRARRALVDAMQGLVVMFALKGRGWSGGIVDLDDMKAEAWIAVFEAIDKFDPSQPEANFSGLCSYLMQERVGMAAREAGVVRLGRGNRTKVASLKLRGLMSDYEAKGLSVQQALHKAAKTLQISETEAAHIMRNARTVAVGVEEGEHEPVDEAPDVVEVINESDTKRVLGEMLDLLDERARGIVVDRANGVSLEEIGEKVGLSRERARRIWGDAITDLQTEAKRRGIVFADLL